MKVDSISQQKLDNFAISSSCRSNYCKYFIISKEKVHDRKTQHRKPNTWKSLNYHPFVWQTKPSSPVHVFFEIILALYQLAWKKQYLILTWNFYIILISWEILLLIIIFERFQTTVLELLHKWWSYTKICIACDRETMRPSIFWSPVPR